MKRCLLVFLLALVACVEPTGVDQAEVGPQFAVPGTSPTVLYVGTGGRFDGPGRIYRIEVETQTVTQVAEMPVFEGSGDVSGLDFDGNGALYAVTGGSIGPAFLATVDVTDGTVDIIGEVPLPFARPTGLPDAGVGSIAFDADGTLFGTAWHGSIAMGDLITIDPSNAALLTDVTMSGGTGNQWTPGLAFDAGGQLYGSRGNSGGHLEDLVLIDKVTAGLTPIGAATTPVSDLWFAPDGRLFGVTPGGDLLDVDPLTGDLTVLFNTGFRMSGLTGESMLPHGQPLVTICHSGVTIPVALPAVDVHLGHGDTRGACSG